MNFKQHFTEQLAKGMSIEDIAKKHDVNVADIQKQIDKGIEVEKEHTGSEEKAKHIAMDHLVEDPEYYTKLDKAKL